ncbi:hypothetical protein THAOC_12752 [Thalassiosira oceanica]|uniref:SAP domain-containing protein n=1 Tax=Thalassiosira oceanica TaxID=159749 RepID=K0SLY5_THAOC|nr:hypothetical protein THAOC_12752 [Thalassiosira oceanica]|eukprot:EJK66335.1 hypothetical protein THAOC_12752 [Thalassiosira oceanica]
MGRRIQQSTSTRSQAASARSELGPTTLTSRSMRLPSVRARGRRLHMSKRSQQLANPTGRQENAFTRLRDSSSASPTIATTDDQSNVATRSVTSSTKAQQPDANNTPTPVDYSSLTVKNLKSILRDRGLQVSGRKADLVQRLEEHDALNQVGARGLGHDVAPVGTQWKEQKWGDSFAKAYLKKSLLDDKSKIHSMTPAEVYLSHPSFACYPKDRFIANLANLKEALRIERERVAEEEKEFLREQSLYPRGKVTSRGSSCNTTWIVGTQAAAASSRARYPSADAVYGRLGTRWQTQRQYELRALIVAASDTDRAHGHPPTSLPRFGAAQAPESRNPVLSPLPLSITATVGVRGGDPIALIALDCYTYLLWRATHKTSAASYS